jgi:hypothetical protein
MPVDSAKESEAINGKFARRTITAIKESKRRFHDKSPFVNWLNIPAVLERVPRGLRRHLAVKLLLSAFVQFLRQSGFRMFYCRECDLAGRSKARVTFSRSGLNRLHLADIGSVPRDMGTDLLAVHGSLIIERTVH